MDPNADKIVWSEGPDRPDGTQPVGWRPVASLKGAISRPPRRGRWNVFGVIAALVATPLLILSSAASDRLPVPLGVAVAAAGVCASLAEVLPEYVESAAPALRVTAHVLGTVAVVGTFAALSA